MQTIADIDNKYLRRLALIMLAGPAMIVLGLAGALGELIDFFEGEFMDVWEGRR